MSNVRRSRILVADDHPVVCAALARLVNHQADLTCCGKVENASSVVSTAKIQLPDLVLLDLSFRDGNGLSLIESLRATSSGIRVLVFSQCDGAPYVAQALEAGARGFVSKRQPSRDILIAIRTVLKGQIYAPQSQDGSSPSGTVHFTLPTVRGKPVSLARRELEVLQLLGMGKRTKDIATQLKLSVKTVETYRENLKQKLCLANAAELIHFAIRWNEWQSAVPPQSFTGKSTLNNQKPERSPRKLSNKT